MFGQSDDFFLEFTYFQNLDGFFVESDCVLLNLIIIGKRLARVTSIAYARVSCIITSKFRCFITFMS